VIPSLELQFQSVKTSDTKKIAMKKIEQSLASLKTPKAAKMSEKTPQNLRAKPIPVEIGGPKGPEPTRFGDWENKGRCSDF